MSQPEAYYIPVELLGGEARESIRRRHAYKTGDDVRPDDPTVLRPLSFDPTVHEPGFRQPKLGRTIVAWDDTGPRTALVVDIDADSKAILLTDLGAARLDTFRRWMYLPTL